MRVLFDHGTPAPLATALQGHAVRFAKSEGWGAPGAVLKVAFAAPSCKPPPPQPCGFQVVAKDYLIDIIKLQPAGKKKMTAEEFLRGNPIVEGMRFGPEVLS